MGWKINSRRVHGCMIRQLILRQSGREMLIDYEANVLSFVMAHEFVHGVFVNNLYSSRVG